MSSEILTLKYDIDKPIPLEEFVASLRSLNSLHSTEGVQLCVKEIRKGSYIFELINQVPDVFNEVMPILVNTSESLGTFAKHVSSILDFFKSGKKPSEDKKITKLITKTESNLKSIADQMSEEFAKMQENSVKREIADFDQYKDAYEEVVENVEPEPAKEPDLLDIAVDNIMKGVFK